MNEAKVVQPHAAFPAGLLAWAGHRDGGVKKPFHRGSGRPTGSAIGTPIVKRLKAWIDGLLLEPTSAPKIVLLVGGPGNGKTDAIEVVIEHLDERITANGRLTQAMTEQYSPASNTLAPRAVSIRLAELGIEIPHQQLGKLFVVQDATERDSMRPGITPGVLLVEELNQALAQQEEGLFIFCVNRGIVSNAVNFAQSEQGYAPIHSLLETILESVTSGPNSPPCWPLEAYPRVSVWPMDVESLVEVHSSMEDRSVAQQIFSIALAPEKWEERCPDEAQCPFCTNQLLLSNPETLDNLIRLLRYYELGSGKRWTFRDLFSLISYALVGLEKEFVIRGTIRRPCDWSKEQVKMVTNPHGDDGIQQCRARLDLFSRLYHHRIFPLWPPLRGETFQKARRELLKIPEKNLSPIKALLKWISGRPDYATTDLVNMVKGSFSNLLDPAMATGDVFFCEVNSKKYSISEVEEQFSLSVRDGLELVKDELPQIEVDLLNDLARSDEALLREDLPRSFSRHARFLQDFLRQFCCRLVKRSIGVRKGIVNCVSYFKEYQNAVESRDGLKEARKQLQGILHEVETGKFISSLATTFGQPIPYRSRNVTLTTERINIKVVPQNSSASRPLESLPYLKVMEHAVPLTYSLYMALGEVGRGMHPSSLPPEIFALLDTIKSMVTGQVARDPEILSDEPWIEIGGCNEKIILDGQSFSIKGREH